MCPASLIGVVVFAICICLLTRAHMKIDRARESGFEAGHAAASRSCAIAEHDFPSEDLERVKRDAWCKGYGDAHAELFRVMKENSAVYPKFLSTNLVPGNLTDPRGSDAAK